MYSKSFKYRDKLNRFSGCSEHMEDWGKEVWEQKVRQVWSRCIHWRFVCEEQACWSSCNIQGWHENWPEKLHQHPLQHTPKIQGRSDLFLHGTCRQKWPAQAITNNKKSPPHKGNCPPTNRPQNLALWHWQSLDLLYRISQTWHCHNTAIYLLLTIQMGCVSIALVVVNDQVLVREKSKRYSMLQWRKCIHY